MIMSLIVAMSENHVIGAHQSLPWHIPADLKRFKAITLGHPVIMGRKTLESIKRPLPKRPNIIVTRQEGYKVEGAQVVHSVDEGLAPYLKTDEEVFILGGGEIFTQTINRCDRLYLTLIHKKFEGDVYFPTFDPTQFKVTFREDLTDPIPFSFIDYARL